MEKRLFKNLLKGSLLVLLVFGLIFFNVAGARACLGGSLYDPCSNPFSFFTGLLNDDSQFGSLAAVGTFFIPTDYSGGAECPFSSAESFPRLAEASVSDGEIHLYAKSTGMFFDWAAGAIYDTYNVDTDNYATVFYEGSLTQNAILAIGLVGEKGFQFTGKFGPATFGENDSWQVKLSDIVSPDEGGDFKMAFAAAVVVWGEESSAIFADFASTLSLEFRDENGNPIYVQETPGGFSQVPIPGTIFLFVPGLIGIFAFRRKKS